MGDNILEIRVAVLEKDVSYLKDGHNEMKAIIKNLEGLTYDIRGVSSKLDTVIDQQKELKKDVKEEISIIEDRLDFLEDEPVKSKSNTSINWDTISNIIKYIGIIVAIIAAVVALINGVDPKVILGVMK